MVEVSTTRDGGAATASRASRTDATTVASGSDRITVSADSPNATKDDTTSPPAAAPRAAADGDGSCTRTGRSGAADTRAAAIAPPIAPSPTTPTARPVSRHSRCAFACSMNSEVSKNSDGSTNSGTPPSST